VGRGGPSRIRREKETRFRIGNAPENKAWICFEKTDRGKERGLEPMGRTVREEQDKTHNRAKIKEKATKSKEGGGLGQNRQKKKGKEYTGCGCPMGKGEVEQGTCNETIERGGKKDLARGGRGGPGKRESCRGLDGGEGMQATV